MKTIHNSRPIRRALAACLAVLATLGAALPAGAAGLSPTSEETYYATLDCYGSLLDSSVVKSVRTFGNPTITDFGAYDQVINLTDSRVPQLGKGQVTFDLTGDVPEKFYFEGKTALPYTQFPWTLSLSYTLNGLPVLAEDLAGKAGVVEIHLDALPKASAPEYSRNNLVLTAVSMFNGDDILSLEAPGAQVQLIGNLYCVLYAALPGEEQHFTIRVGTDDFTYSGMIFLAVPATLEQLDQVAELKEAKEEAEDSYHAILDSMHAILDSMEGMSGSLNAAAGGLDQLNRARATVSSGKGQVYDSTDAALEALGALAESLGPIASPPPEETPEDGEAASEGSVSDTETTAQAPAEEPSPEEEAPPAKQEKTEVPFVRRPASPQMSSSPLLDTGIPDVSGDPLPEEEPEDFGPDGHLSTARQALSETHTVLNAMSKNLTSLRPEVKKTQETLRSVQSDLAELKTSSVDFHDIALRLTKDTEELRKSLRNLSGELGQAHWVSGISSPTGAITAQVKEAGDKYKNYMQATGQQISFYDFLTKVGGKSPTEANLIVKAANGELDSGMTMVNGMFSDVNGAISEVNSMLNEIMRPTGRAVDDLADLTATLKKLADLTEHLSNGESITPIENMQELTDQALRVSENVDIALAQLDTLNEIMNTYYPDTQQAIADAQTVVISTSKALSTLTGAAKDAEDLLRQSGSDLDAGTRNTLAGVASSLRKATSGLDQTHTIRSAVDIVDALLTDQWDSHTGEDNNVLLMDASAPPQSLTDSRNQSVGSIQYIMRTQEIKVNDAEDETPLAEKPADTGTIWSRILDMFRDLWSMITGIFS